MLRPRSVLAAAVTLAATACSSAVSPESVPREITALPRELSQAELKLISASNNFAFDLFRQSAGAGDSNVFVSPLSVSMALGMTLNGARGTTLDAMRSTLRYDGVSIDDINSGYRGLIDLLRNLDNSTEIRVANSIWHRNSLPPAAAFKDRLSSSFDAEMRGVNFSDAGVPGQINSWVSQATSGRIDELISSVEPDDLMYLINAIYFKGKWREEFDPDRTRAQTFHASYGGEQTVQMMNREPDSLRMLQTPDFSAAELLYGNTAFGLVLIVPREGVGMSSFIESLNSRSWDEWMAGLVPSRAHLALPRFELEYTRQLKDDLQLLGMGVAFSDGADFTGMWDGDDPGAIISSVLHKTALTVNEEGTEAAAATAVTIVPTSMPPSVVADRPFVLAIRERYSGTILFIGVVNRVHEDET